MGCMIGSIAPDEATCNATCASAKNCVLNYGPYHFSMCGYCPNKWLDPATLQPVILPGGEPWWPPGFEINGCDQGTCELGCRMAFDSSLAPPPPVEPPSPPDVPEPPAPWPSNNGTGFNFSVVFSDSVVLQQAPAKAAVYGQTGAADSNAVVSVTVTPSSGDPYTVPATVTAGRWKALLEPTPDTHQNITYTITASCASGCTGASSVTLSDVVFGDVW